jgi:hypothetical protein
MSKARNLATLLSSDGSVKTTKYADSVGGQSDFVASGTLPNASPVILNSDGTVSVVGLTATDVTLTLDWIEGSYTTLSNLGSIGILDGDFNPSVANQFIVVYGDKNNSDYMTVAVGTVSGTTITFGTHVVLLSSYTASAMIKFNPNRSDQFLVFYQDDGDSYKRKVIAGTISGTTPSFPYSSIDVTTSYGVTGYLNCMEFDPFTADKFLVFYQNNNSGPLEVRVCSVNSGGTITLGTAVLAGSSSGTASYFQISLDKNTANQFLIIWRDTATSGSARAGTISGTTCTFGTTAIWDSANPYYIVVASEKGRAGKFLVASYDQPNGGRTQLRVLTVTGTTVTAGSVTNLANGPFYTLGMHNDPNAVGKFIFTGQSGGGAPYAHQAYIANVSSGDVVTVAGPYDMSNGGRGSTFAGAICFDPNNGGKVIFGGGYSPTQGNGTKFAVSQLGGVYQGYGSNLTATNFIGISSAAYADTATATLNLQGGTATNLSGLTAGSTYYVQTDATLGTSAGNPSVEVGKALSATSILLKGI